MTALDRILPVPALVEHHHADVAANPARVWQHVRHMELARSPIVRILFALRTLPDRIAGEHEPLHIRIDDLVSSPVRPGFQILIDDPPYEVTVGAIGKVWRLAIPFVHVDGPDAFASFSEPGFVKVAWAVRVVRRRRSGARVEIELRVAATDPASWRLFERYFRLIGPPSRFIRQAALARIARELAVQHDLDDPSRRRCYRDLDRRREFVGVSVDSGALSLRRAGGEAARPRGVGAANGAFRWRYACI